jgi:4-amino-4-deoxy-L-arabinose transferase-like glycosyltransferase
MGAGGTVNERTGYSIEQGGTEIERAAGHSIQRATIILWIILLLGLVVRIIYFLQLRASDLGDVLSLDSSFYRDLASTLSSGGGLPAGALTFNPLYPAFLAFVFRLFGEGLDAPRLIQMCIGLVTIYLVYLSGRRLAGYGRRGLLNGELIGLIAAGMTLFYPHLILYEGSLLATSLVTFSMIASFALALVCDQDLTGVREARILSRRVPLWIVALILGAVLGAGALGRPNLFFILIVAVPVWLLFRCRRRSRGVLLALATLAGAAILLLPPVVYNASQTGRFVPVTAHGGINFYIGNRPGARPIYKPPEWMRKDMQGAIQDSKMRAEQETGRSLSGAEASNYWFRLAMRGIASDPVGWLRLLGEKLRVFWNGIEIPDVVDISFYRDACPVSRILILPFAVISPLSILGLIVLATGARNRSIVYLYVGVSLASVLAAYVSSRYRIPAIPVLILCAAGYVSWAINGVLSGRRTRVLASGALLIALFFLVAAPEIIVVNRSAAYTFLGNHYLQIKKEEKAEAAFAEAYRLDPDRIENKINYARALRLRGRDQRALEFYALAFAKDRTYPKLAIEYGSLLERQGRREEAKQLYRYAYSLQRRHDRVLACKMLSRLAYADGNRDEATSWIRKALELVPGEKSLVELLHKLEGEP